MNSTALFWLGIPIAALLFAADSRADLFPGAVTGYDITSSTGVNQQAVVPLNSSISNVESPTTFQLVQSSGIPSVLAEVSGGGIASVEIDFEFMVVGPAVASPITVLASDDLQVDGNNTTTGLLNNSVVFAITNSSALSIEDDNATPGFPSIKEDIPVSVVPDTFNAVELSAVARVNPGDPGNLSIASGNIFLSLDPTLIDEGYSVVFSDGIESEAVPETSTLALAGVGILLIAIFERRIGHAGRKPRKD